MLLLVSVFLSSCTPQIKTENHIHSLAFDPTEEEVLYIGTHYFLEKYQGTQTERLGRYGDDFMGFVIATDGLFYSSGHSPTVRNVGIRKSTDKGQTWTTLAYEGLDFHDIAVGNADPNVIYAWSTPPEPFLTLSTDTGKTWTKAGNTLGKDLYSLAADHQQADTLYAGTLFGLFVSEDLGKTWQEVLPLVNDPILAVADDPKKEGVMYVSTYLGGILKTTDNGITWSDMNVGLPPRKEDALRILTVNPHNASEVWGATAHGQIYRYDGSSWKKTDIGVK